MDLLTFAHRGEAKAFLKELPFKPLNFAFEGLYQSNDHFLLITGEGVQATSEKLAAVLGAFNEIKQVLNFGVCGSLENKFNEGEIHPIRTCYLEKKSGMEFKSFSTDINNGIDCVSAHQRVLSIDYAKYLSHFAPLVDREVWAIGSVSSLFKKSFYSYKYISDHADGEELCQMVSLKAQEISNTLYNHFLNLNFSEKVKNITPEIKGTHFTISQKRLYNSLIKKIKIKGMGLTEIVNLDKINALPLSPKQKAARILKEMEAALFPFNEKVNLQLKNLIDPCKEQGLKIKLSKSFEQDEIEVSSVVKNDQDLARLIDNLKKFPLNKIQKVFKGQIDV
ncbi:MAG: hypothetical protein DRQ88_01810 [Epsilonproteobacteria bacterium]|nr:MAG: hypothetical protein DRQ89_08655 [Campylobacterota bacterium]RLA67813.1 MAG: hypothetical protein DRQ88_01810 [Campylobacterota bacterium]